MNLKRIHIVSLDVPFPPNYGGVIDIYNRAKALKDAGVEVVLHTFEYGRGRKHDFSEIASEIHYYSRENLLKSLFSGLPYIVKSRQNKLLLQRLQADQDPILLEGQHCTAWVNELAINGRKIVIRQHNVEHDYYSELAKRTPHFFKRLFFIREARLLRKHLNQLKELPFLCLSSADLQMFDSIKSGNYLLPVTLLSSVNQNRDLSDFILFHGNLSIPENEESVLRICYEHHKNAFATAVVIAGKQPSVKLKTAIEKAGFQLIENPDTSYMLQLQQTCRLHLLIGFQVSGIKLKLLQSLRSNGAIITTKAMLQGTELESFCSVWDEKSSLAELVEKMTIPTHEELAVRHAYLEQHFSTTKTLKVLATIFD